MSDRVNIKVLVETHRDELFRFCLYLSGNRQMSEDLVHDAFVKAIQQYHQLKDVRKAFAWLKQIARNLFLDYLKSAHVSKTHVELDESTLVTETENSAELITAVQALQSLGEEDRALLILIDVQEHSYAEAAEVLSVPEGTIKSRLFRARAKFSDFFNGTKRAASSS